MTTVSAHNELPERKKDSGVKTTKYTSDLIDLLEQNEMRRREYISGINGIPAMPHLADEGITIDTLISFDQFVDQHMKQHGKRAYVGNVPNYMNVQMPVAPPGVSQTLPLGQLKQGGGLVNDFINNLPFELHLVDQGDDGKIKKASFAGPGTRLGKRLRGYDAKTGTYDSITTPPINKLDEGAMFHDICYDQYTDTDNRNTICDADLRRIAREVVKSPDSTIIQAGNARLVQFIMEEKQKRGLGMVYGHVASNGGRIPVVPGSL